MRRILLGGLGIALGAFASPAFAQQRTPAPPPTRGAAFGKPSAVPDPAAGAPSDPAVTPAGLFRNGPARPTVVNAPPNTGGFGTPVPVISQPPVVGGAVPGAPVIVPGAPVIVPGAPVIVPGATPVPGAVVVPGGVPVFQPAPGNPIPAPRPVPGAPMVTETRDPTGRIPNGVVVPSVVPDGFDCPEVTPDDPLFEGRPRLGLDRLRGVGGGKTWVSAELLLWWNRSSQIPPLVTGSSAAANGIVGQGDTRVLLGGSFGSTNHAGGRIGFGHWFGDGECRGMDARLFWVAPASSTFVASSPPAELLARPFFNVNPTTAPTVGAGSTAEVVAAPGVAGRVAVTLKSTVWGAEMNYRRYLFGDACARVDALVGYRYLDLREDLSISETFIPIPGATLPDGAQAASGIVTDRFRTENHFHGGQIGLVGTVQRGRWSLDGRGTIAFGTVFQSADISGGQALRFPDGSTAVVPGGLLAVPGANMGHFSQTRFAVVPEVGVNLGYQLTSRMKVFFGYNFLYLSSAVRPGEVIDTRVDAARVPNLLAPGTGTPVAPARPMPLLSTSGYFIQGITFGMTYRW